MKKIFVLIILLFYFFVNSKPSFATEKIGIYGFYLGQTIQEVLDNAAEKGYTLEKSPQSFGGSEILKIIQNLPNGKSVINGMGGGLGVFPKPVVEILSLDFRSMVKEFISAYGKLSSQVILKDIKDIFFTLFIDGTVDRPRISLEMVWEVGTSNMTLFSIYIDFNGVSKEVLEKIDSTLLNRYGKFTISEVDGLSFIEVNNFSDKFIVKCKRFFPNREVKLDPLTGILFYDCPLIKKIMKPYIDFSKDLESKQRKKALDDI